ncbi:MAG: Hpt domain-containing protein [Spirochaetes bacterium]|nr:Hpt domain-containing protein [Spirochaetota bacterium]
MDIEIPGIDAKKGLDLYDDDFEIYVTVLRSYVTNTPAALDKLRNVSAETLANYAIYIHGVKGTSASIGAEEVRKTAAQLEIMAKVEDLQSVQAWNEAFLKSVDELLNNIQSWLKQHSD